MSERIGGRAIDVSELIERQKIRWFTIRLIAASWIITFFDGFDMNVISYVAPYLISDFDMSRVSMGTLFSIGLLGTMAGGFLFGYLGDRFGRRPAILIASFSFAVLTLCFGLARSYEQLMLLRFINGIAIGGLLPVCWALNIEYVPRYYRATVVTIVMLGYSVGSSVGGPVTILLAPEYGWQAVYIFAGAGTLAAAALLYFTLPESARFLASKGRRPDLLARYMRQIAPDEEVEPGARFIVSDEDKSKSTSFRVSVLFERNLIWITPLLWGAYIASSMAIFFKSSWTPMVLELIGYTRTEAAAFTAISSMGGALGALVLMRFTDRKGPIAIAIMSLISIPPLLYIGLAQTGYWSFLIINFIVNIAMGGAHFGMHSIAGIFYSSSFRANGAGWATSVAKVGSVIGPMVGGMILATSFPVKNIFALLAICPTLVALALFFISRIHARDSRHAAAPPLNLVPAEQTR
ncbi:MAG TPA: MFS transporter [Sphingobium sp.]|nr:MFS transporter [Sphingobium sp.]